MHYISERKIQFADVDAAGILYYPRFFSICHNTFEKCFDEKGPFSYAEMIKQYGLGFPAVKVEANFLLPMAHGDLAKITMNVERIGNSSITVHYEIINETVQKTSFIADITNVCMDLSAHKSVPISETLRTFLNELK